MKMYCNCISLYIITWNKGENKKKKKKKKKCEQLSRDLIVLIDIVSFVGGKFLNWWF